MILSNLPDGMIESGEMLVSQIESGDTLTTTYQKYKLFRRTDPSAFEQQIIEVLGDKRVCRSRRVQWGPFTWWRRIIEEKQPQCAVAVNASYLEIKRLRAGVAKLRSWLETMPPNSSDDSAYELGRMETIETVLRVMKEFGL